MKSHFFIINEYNYFISLKFYGRGRNLGQLENVVTGQIQDQVREGPMASN